MIRQLVFVHGRSQQKKDARKLKLEWMDAWQEGLAKSGLALPISEEQIRFPYYGDTLDQMTGGMSPEEAAGIVVRGEKPLPVAEEEFFRAWLEDLQKAHPEITDEDVAAALRAGQKRGMLNWKWVQAILEAMDRKVPGASALSVALATRDVHQYLNNSTFRTTLDKGVRSAFTAGRETVVVGHSLGTIVAYNVLVDERATPKLDVPHFITLGSPLAVKAVKDHIRPLKTPDCVGTWFNAMDDRDVVALFPLNKKNFQVIPEIENKTDVRNNTSNHHGISGYLSDAVVARRIHEALTGA